MFVRMFLCLYTVVLVLPPLLTAPCADLVTSHLCACAYACVYVYIYVCIYICIYDNMMYVCVYVYVLLCLLPPLLTAPCADLVTSHLCACVYMYVYMYMYMYGCIYVYMIRRCMYVSMSMHCCARFASIVGSTSRRSYNITMMCMCICVCIYIYIYVWTYICIYDKTMYVYVYVYTLLHSL